MRTVLLPVKDFRAAKQRLAQVLTLDQRIDLARAMLTDVLNVLAQSRAPERVAVFTASDEVADMAAAHNFEIFAETHVAGHSAAVNQMLADLSPSSSQILALAADLPKLAPEDVDFVMSHAPEPITVIHSRDGTGTNGIVFVPPARIDVEYGNYSFSRHLSKAAAAGFRAGVLNVPGIAFDLDTPEDLREFMSDPQKNGATWRFLSSLK